MIADLLMRLLAWRMRWLPWRSAVFIGFDEKGEAQHGPWRWNRPTVFDRHR